MSITAHNLSAVLARALEILETDLQAELDGDPLDLPTIETFAIGEPTVVEPDDFPAVCIHGHMGSRPFAAGRIVEPTTYMDVFGAFAWAGTNDAYVQGCRIAELALKVLMANDDDPPNWEKINLGSLAIRPAYDGVRYQGGVGSLELVGPDVIWS